MKATELEPGKVYAYQRGRRPQDNDNPGEIEAATFIEFKTTWRGAPMAVLTIKRWAPWREEWREEREEVPLSSLKGEYEAEKARREALQARYKEEARLWKEKCDREEAEREANLYPVQEELAKLLSDITGKRITRTLSLSVSDFNAQEAQAVIEKLRRIG